MSEAVEMKTVLEIPTPSRPKVQPARTSQSCNKGRRWTPEEDELLRLAVEEFGEKNWRKIAERISGRTSVQCLHRWSKILRPGLVKGPWRPDEDEKLRIWVQDHGANHWSDCAKQIPGRNGKQCRERWNNALNPDLKKGNWTYKEDLKIIELYFQLGGKWSQMIPYLNGRSENAIKNRFYSNLRKMINMKRKGVSQIEVPQDLTQIVDRHKIMMSYDDFLCRRAMTNTYKLMAKIQQIQSLMWKRALEESNASCIPIPGIILPIPQLFDRTHMGFNV